MERSGKPFPAIFLWIILWSLLACSTREQQTLEPEEANLQVLGAYAAKDLACSHQSNLVFPIVARVDQEELDSCIANILALDCNAWASGTSLPAACATIQIDL